jgi:hypothetical protein
MRIWLDPAPAVARCFRVAILPSVAGLWLIIRHVLAHHAIFFVATEWGRCLAGHGEHFQRGSRHCLLCAATNGGSEFISGALSEAGRSVSAIRGKAGPCHGFGRPWKSVMIANGQRARDLRRHKTTTPAAQNQPR